MQVTVYSKPNCPQCNATYTRMDRMGVNYRVIDVTTDSEALSYILGLGHQQAPVVVVGTTTWSGYRPDLIDALVP